MHEDAYFSISRLQGSHWWHQARAELSENIIRKYLVEENPVCLDLGCGPGGLLNLYKSLNSKLVIGLDVSPIALKLSRAECPDARLIAADLNSFLPFSEDSFDVVSIFGVLYHEWINDECGVLSEVARVLKPNGLLLLVEPSFPILERNADAYVMGARRYRLKQIEKFISQTELITQWSSYFSAFAFPIALLIRWVEAIIGRKNNTDHTESADMKPVSPLLNKFFLALARLENSIFARGGRMPFGVTLIIAARKKEMK